MTPVIQQLRHDAEEFNRNPLEVLIQLRALAAEIDEAIDAVTPLAVQEADKYPGKSFTAYGMVIEKRNGTTRYAYPDFGPYSLAKSRAKALEELMKQVAATGVALADAETGEMVPAAIPSVSSPTLAIKVKK